MIRIVSSYKSIEPAVLRAIQHYQNGEQVRAWTLMDQEILQHKVKFPILEKVAVAMDNQMSYALLDSLIDRAAKAKHISCYPIIGKLLQLRLSKNLNTAYDEAITHIIWGNEWYACDIIAERVFGEGTLYNFETSITEFRKMANHENIWIQRSIGIASHYATKKKLPKEQVERLFLLMLENGHKTQFYIKKGIGWAAKTIAKHHPDIIHKHSDLIRSTPKLSRWFLGKMNIGLSMAKAEPLVL